MGVAYDRLTEFANSYSKAVMNDDPVLETHTFNDLFSAKVTPTLRSLGLRDEESVAVSALVGQWADEQANLPEDVLGSLGVRR
jgi:hypothetical protein